jgi:hypothetical protein
MIEEKLLKKKEASHLTKDLIPLLLDFKMLYHPKTSGQKSWTTKRQVAN